MLNEALLKISTPILERNSQFKNLHKGQSCYIFGDGVSLKDMSLECFGDKIAFGSNFLCLHNDFSKLNVKYYSAPAPFWFYPFWTDHRTKKMKINNLSLMQRKFMKQNKHINFFINLSNAPLLMGRNIYYFHHFGSRHPINEDFDMCGKFFYDGALNSLISMAIYMGFTKAHLVGCDYTHSPQRILHFYEKGRGKIQYNDEYNKDYFNFAKKSIKLKTITNLSSHSKCLEYISYDNFTGHNELYKENNEIVNYSKLKTLNGWEDYKVL